MPDRERSDESPASGPLTGAIPVRLRDRLDPRPRLRRVRESFVPIAQIVVAATGAYAFSLLVLQHSVPLLAATVTVSSLGLARDARPRRLVESISGMLVGILIAELILLVAGQGVWQVAVSLFVTLLVARLLAPQPGFAVAAAIQALIVMIMPASGALPFGRLLDGVVGGVAALAVTALLPRDLSAAAVRDARAVFGGTDRALQALIQGLRRGDRLRAERGLARARAIDQPLARWRESLESARAVARISPWLRRRVQELDRQAHMLAALDFACRNLRVVARRVVYLTDDRRARPVPADLLASVARAFALVEAALTDIEQVPIARASIGDLAEHLDPTRVLPGESLGDQNLVAALRPLAVDLLVAVGSPRDEAYRMLPRI